MLPKIYRTTIPIFRRASQRSKRFPLSCVTAFCKLNNQTSPRFVVSVPKQLDKRASHRNKTKRYILEEIYSHLPLFNTTQDYLIIARKIIKKEEKIELQKNIELLAQK